MLGFGRALLLPRHLRQHKLWLWRWLPNPPSRSLSSPSPSLSDLLSQIASESRSRQEFVQELKTISSVVSCPDWDPNSRGALAPLGITLTPHHVAELIRAQPHPVWALRIFIWAGRQPEYTHNDLARREIVKMWDHNQLFEPFLDVLENSGDPEFVMTPETYNLLIKGYGWAEMLHVAITTLDRMKSSGLTPDISHFHSLMYPLVRANRLKKVRELYEQMLEAGISPNSVTYALRVRAYCTAGQVDEAFKTFNEMLKKGFAPDVRTFGELVDCMCKANKVYRMYQLLYEMHEKGFTPDETIYYALLEGLCRNNSVKHAERLVHRLLKKGVEKTATVYNILAKGLCRERKVHSAHVLVNDMLNYGFLPEANVFNLVVILLFKEGQLREVFRFVDKLINKGFLPNVSTYNILIYGLSKFGEVGKAFEAWNILLHFCLPSAKSYRALLEGLCKAGRLTEAKEVFKTTMRGGGTGDAAAHGQLLFRLRQAGKIGDVKECEDIMEARSRASGDLINIFQGVESSFQKSSPTQSADTFDEMEKHADQGMDFSSDENSSDDDNF